jgi:hypothetical protein
MAVPRGAFSRPFMHTPPSRDHGDGNVLAVGWRVRVTSPAGRGHRVSLTDSEGTTTVTTLPDGTEVEILAWRPRRSGATLYRVQPTSGGKEGWLSGASLKAQPAPVPQKVRPIAAARPQPASKSAPKAAPKAVSKPLPKPVSKAVSKTISRVTATKAGARTSRRKTAR